MNRHKIRGGIGAIRTATQLKSVLPVPLLMLVEGHAWVKFPFFTSARPSLGVLVRSATGSFWVNRNQWNSVAVPLLEKFAAGTNAGRTAMSYDPTTPGLYGGSDTALFLQEVGNLVYDQALSAGYK